MKTIGKFSSFGHGFTVKVKTMQTNSNYNQFCHVFHEKEKMPLIGYTFKDNTSKNDIIAWAKNQVIRLQSEELANDCYKHCQPKTAEERWPEYAKEAERIAINALREINNTSIDLYREKGIKCPYPAQCLLEMVVKILEARV